MNETQPTETVSFILAEHQRRKPGVVPVVAVLGMAFKGVPATDDLRGAMSLKVLAALQAHVPGARIRLFDPVCAPADLAAVAQGAEVSPSLDEAIAGADIVIIANNHPALGARRPRHIAQAMAPGGFIYDYWNHFSDLRTHELDGAYLAVGNTLGRAAAAHPAARRAGAA